MTFPRAALMVAGVAAATGLVGQLGAISRWADAINYLTPVWFGIGLSAAAIAALALPGRLRWAGVAAIVLLLSTGGINLLHGAGAHATGGQPTLTIVQFNVSKGNRDPAGAAAWILAQKADLVVLEEAALRGAAIKTRLSATYPHATDCLGDAGRCSTVILSRQAPVAAEGLALGDPENRKTLSAVRARFVDAAGPFTVVGIHLRRPWPYDDQTNDIARLSQLLELEDQSRLIVVGDFNQPPWTFAMRRQDEAMRIPRLTGRLATWPIGRVPIGGLSLPLPALLPIDHAYAGKRWRLVTSRRGPDLGSEHRPLFVALADAPSS